MRPSSRLSSYLKRIDNLLQTMVTSVFTLFLCGFALPIFLLFGAIFYLNRQVAVISARVFKKGQLAKPLTLLSSAMANFDQIYTSPYNNLQFAMILEGIPDMEKIRDTVKRQLLERLDPKTGEWLYPEMFQNVSYWMDYPFWRKFDPQKVNSEWFLQECVYIYEKNEMQKYDFWMLEQILNKLSLAPFSKDKPLIEFIILPKFTPHPEKNAGLSPDGNYFVAIIRVHHALADGLIAVRIAQNLSTNTDQFEYIEGQDYTKQGKLQNRSIFTKCFKNLTILLKMSYEVTETLFNERIFGTKYSLWPEKKNKPKSVRSSSWNTVMIIPTPINSEDNRSYEMLNQKRLRNLKTAHGNPFNISEINEIKKLHGVSGTTVLFGAIVGAVRKTLFNPQAKLIPQYIQVGIPLLLPGRTEKLRNRDTLGVMYIPLSEPDGVKRLHKIQRRIKSLQKSTIPIALAIFTTFIAGQLPRWALKRLHKNRTRNSELLGLTNVAGPKTMFDFGGYPMRDFVFGTGITTEKRFPLVAMGSVGGRVRLCVISDSAIIPSHKKAQEVMDNFFGELEILREAGMQHQQPHGITDEGEKLI